MLESLNESIAILDKFKITNSYHERKMEIDGELHKLNERIEQCSDMIKSFCNHDDKQVREVYDNFTNSLFLIVNSRHTLKINNGLGNFDDLSYLLSIIKEANEQLDTMIFMERG